MMKWRTAICLAVVLACLGVLLTGARDSIDASGSTNKQDRTAGTYADDVSGKRLDFSPYNIVRRNYKLVAEKEGDMTSDDHFAEISKQFPDFGGLFYGEDGTLQVYMVGQREPMSRATEDYLKSMISAEILSGESLEGTLIEVVEGKYTFLQLKEWHDRLSESVLPLPGVIFTDIDDRTNRLRIGVENLKASKKTVEKNLLNLSIPLDAVEITRTKPFTPQLADLERSLKGGIQIEFTPYLCTMGFIADRGSVRGFVTNSHCSGTGEIGGNQSTDYHQPNENGTTNRIGEEANDPALFTGSPCPAGRNCRFSDAAFVRVPHPSGPATGSSRGYIARPPNGSAVWNNNDLFSVTSEADPVVGQTVIKVGRTTGRTSGPVTSTCVNLNADGVPGNVTLLCQAVGTISSAGGDSGSPVFRITSGDNVALAGMMWGTDGTASAFSPISGIQRASHDLGVLSTCIAGITC